MQAELAEVTARSAAAHEEYEGSLREAQLSAQSAHSKAESADAEWRRAVLQLQEKVAALQVWHLTGLLHRSAPGVESIPLVHWVHRHQDYRHPLTSCAVLYLYSSVQHTSSELPC